MPLRSESRHNNPGVEMDVLEYQRWLLNLQGTTADQLYMRAFNEFCQFAKMNPEELPASFDKDKGQTAHDLEAILVKHVASL